MTIALYKQQAGSAFSFATMRLGPLALCHPGTHPGQKSA